MFLARNIRFSNDSEEYKRGGEIVKEYVQKTMDDDQKCKELEEKMYQGIQMYYMVCFCEDGDLLSQWRGYAKDGVSFGMDFLEELAENAQIFTVLNNSKNRGDDEKERYKFNDEYLRLVEMPYQVFYTEEEKSQNLQHGFYAHPNIGCVFFSDFKNKEFDSCLSQIERELDGGQKVSVALVGSIFGGTGAAGIPTIFKILKEKFCGNNNWGNLCISGIFFVPYFKVCDTDQEKNITIRSDRFYFNTYEALSYYNATNPDGLKSIYIVGQQSLDFVNNQYADGGAAQDNKPHMVELYAALAIDKFFSHPEQSGVFGSIRTKKLGWNGFPRVDRDNPTQMTYMADFARAQAVFVAEICGFIETDGEKLDNWCKKRGIMVPQWYVKYGMKNQEQIKQAEQIKSYGVAFLDWLYKVNCTYDGSERLHLDERICLFGSALESVYQISTEQREKIEDRNWLKEFRNKFNTFVDVTSNVEYVLDKALLILSMAGIVSGSSAALGAVGLFLKIVALAGGQKEKGINARNNRSI